QATTPTQTYTLSLHDALPIYKPQLAPTISPALSRHLNLPPGLRQQRGRRCGTSSRRGCHGGEENVGWRAGEPVGPEPEPIAAPRSEEHTSELQSRGHLVCRLL